MGFNDPAVVICSDSQETAEDFRVEVQKIKPIDVGSYQLVIGGSGNIGALIDGQAEAIERNVKRWPAGLSEVEAQTRLEQILRSYNNRHVKDYPIADDMQPEYKVMDFLICARDKTNSQIYLWKTSATTIKAVGNYALVGWQAAAYYYHLKWLYRSELSKFRATLIGLQLLRSAQDNLYIGDPFHVIEVDRDGMRTWPAENVRLLEERAVRFNKAMAELLITFPRLERGEDQFERFLQQLQEAIAAFRMQQAHLLGDVEDRYRAELIWEQEQERLEREEYTRKAEADERQLNSEHSEVSTEPPDSETSESQW